VRCPDFVAREEIEFRRGAHRYEAGTHNILGLVGLRTSLELILELGVETIAAELTRKRGWLVSALLERGWEVPGADAGPVHQSGIVSIRRPGIDFAALHERLLGMGIVCSLRVDRAGQRYLRLSPHFYNSDAELARAVDALRS
jgi:selenocysteine lyase/cysteine desulfurase